MLKIHLTIYALLISILTGLTLTVKYYHGVSIRQKMELALRDATIKTLKNDKEALEIALTQQQVEVDTIRRTAQKAVDQLKALRGNHATKAYMDANLPADVRQWLLQTINQGGSLAGTKRISRTSTRTRSRKHAHKRRPAGVRAALHWRIKHVQRKT